MKNLANYFVTGHTTKTEPDCLPISDNNVSTTANDTLADTETEWDNDADINVSTKKLTNENCYEKPKRMLKNSTSIINS